MGVIVCLPGSFPLEEIHAADSVWRLWTANDARPGNDRGVSQLRRATYRATYRAISRAYAGVNDR